MTRALSAQQKATVSRISGLVLINAMIFQEVLAEHDRRVLSVEKLLGRENTLHEIAEHWRFILRDIDYYPIFHVACQILEDLTATEGVTKGLRELAKAAQVIVSMRAALRHDLMGRVYHRLLVEAKYLGTYYTTIPAATLLAKLALRRDAWRTRWHHLDQLSRFRVVDLACGTGTLLMAAADALADDYISESAGRAQQIDLSGLHEVLAEHVLHGYDVLPSAIHLTASTLALRAPQIAFTRMNLFSLPLAGPEHRLGSIEFLDAESAQIPMDLFGALPATQRISGEGAEIDTFAPVPRMDLCIMNPPFTRSVGGNLLFGSAPQSERQKMRKKLKGLVNKTKAPASITAGLGSVFVATADQHLEPDGRLALVLPKTLLSGVAWNRTRSLLRKRYRVEYIVASQHPGRWNFSENTSLSEVLLVASRVARDACSEPEPTAVVAVNLWRNPHTSFEALALSDALVTNPAPDIGEGQGALDLLIGNDKVGEAVSYRWDELAREDLWMLPCSFGQSELIRATYYLLRSALWLPGHGKVGELQLSPLKRFGALGPDRRDVSDGFARSRTATAYRAFWGHSAQAVRTMAQKHNSYLSPLAKAKRGRPLRKVEDLWPLAGTVLIAERLRLNTQSLVALRLPGPVLSNVWWPFAPDDEFQTDDEVKALVLWLNSTLGLLCLLAHRQETEGAWVDFKKPALDTLPVLDLGRLTRQQVRGLAHAYDTVCEESLRPFPQMDNDPVRTAIDAHLAKHLGLQDFSVLRSMLAREPLICLRPL